MGTKLFIAYIALLSIVCFLGGTYLFKLFLGGAVWAFFVGLLVLVVGVIYAFFFILGVRPQHH